MDSRLFGFDPEQVRPNFLIIGAGKSGTTSLWSALSHHPAIDMSSDKEPSFFSDDDRYARGWGWSEELFEAGKEKQSIGEASRPYSACGIYQQINAYRAFFPDERILVLFFEDFRSDTPNRPRLPRVLRQAQGLPGLLAARLRATRPRGRPGIPFVCYGRRTDELNLRSRSFRRVLADGDTALL